MTADKCADCKRDLEDGEYVVLEGGAVCNECLRARDKNPCGKS